MQPYDENLTYASTNGRPKIVEVVWRLYPSGEFVDEVINGNRHEGPTAIVILGGLFTSTALNLLVLPTLTLRYGWFEAAEARGEMPESAWNGIGRPASPAD